MGVGSNVLMSCKRKEARGRAKKLKKLHKAAFASRKKVEDVIAEKFAVKKPEKEEKNKRKKRKKGKSVSEANDQEQEQSSENNAKKSKTEDYRKRELIRALREDEVEIKRLSKKLGYNKRKSKNVPQVFAAEGLDYVLEMCDFKKSKEALSGSENEEDFVDESLEAENDLLSDEDVDEEEQAESSGEQNVEEVEEEPDVEDEIKEDIYGRIVDKKTGSVIPSNSGARAKLEELEKKSSVANNEERLKLERTIRGIFNRLNENTIVTSTKTMKELFLTHGHNDVKHFFYEFLRDSVAVGYRLPDRILIEFALFVALLHTTVSYDLSSHFVEHFILEYLKVLKFPTEDKALENMSVLLAELYNFKVIKNFIITELVERLVYKGTDKSLECAKLLLAYTGTLFKKRDFDSLQKCIAHAQQLLSELPEETFAQQHMRFITEEFMDIKNGNVRKWTDAIDFSLFEHYMSIYRGLTKKMDKEDELGMSIDDIEHVEERGRWWLVGSAWMPSSELAHTSQQTVTAERKPEISGYLLQLAKKAKMNTSVRRDVFCTLVSSKNESDAFEKLMRLSLKGQQEREIIHICIHCALQEAVYNSFYSAVIEQFCLYHKRFKLTTQYALWDRIKNLASFQKWQQSHLAALIADLIIKRSISLTVLKVVEFGAIDPITTQYLRLVLKKVLLGCSNAALREIFLGIVTSSSQKVFSQGLQIFIHMVLKKSTNEKLLAKIDFLDSIWGDDRL